MADYDDPFEGVPGPLIEAMRQRGFEALTPVQRAVVDAQTRGANLRISSQTGSGKTVAIGLALAPGLLERDAAPSHERRAPSVLIIAPTRELAVQIEAELAWLFAGLRDVHTCVVTGGTDIMRERRALRRGATIVVGTPGRLLDHIGAGALPVDGLRHVVLDEADRMLDMGFKDELDAIMEALPSERRSHLVSATFPSAVVRFADRFQPGALHLEGTRLGEANADIEHTVYMVDPRDHYAALVNLLLLTGGERCLVFVRRRMETTELAERLAADGFSALPFSGDLPQGQRTRTLNAFRTDVVRILVATDVAARGIDVADIATVVHIDLPADAETYTHRSGRTGRAGQKGRSLLLAPSRAERRLRAVLRQAKVEATWCALPSPSSIDKSLKKRARRRIHRAMTSEAETSEALLDYANALLKQYEPAELVARLVDLARPELPRAPMDYECGVQGPRARRSTLDDDGDSDGRRSRDGQAFEPFQIAFGARDGASPARLLATICRRGDVSGRDVGAIRIGEEASGFEIAAGVAEAFFERASQPDDRAPEQTIERAHRLPDRTDRPRQRQ
ncbi:MAG: DEAD/DEAH box helicase, partial [Myxococcales bacterium]|nr:DEAD/DEAH box helicase [Myxococcales bacterium]